MALSDYFTSIKEKFSTGFSNFFYEGKDAASAPQRGRRAKRESAFAEQEPAAPLQNQQWQQPYQQNNGYPYNQGMQQPQQTYQPGYQQQAYGQADQRQARFRRGAQHVGQEQPVNNVVQVDFGGFQPQTPQQTYQEPAPVQQSAGLLNARVINARSMGDCRSAITLLRNGDAVLVVMENITNPGDMRRLVDTLSGACYSLTATITKVSRYGVYLLAPQALAVFTDQETTRMNAGPVRAQAQTYQPGQYAPQRPLYTAAPQPAQQQPQGHDQGFTQRMAVPEEGVQNFYQRAMPQDASIPSFSTRPVGNGFAAEDAGSAAAQ